MNYDVIKLQEYQLRRHQITSSKHVNQNDDTYIFYFQAQLDRKHWYLYGEDPSNFLL